MLMITYIAGIITVIGLTAFLITEAVKDCKKV